jgi:hypothetical protein
MALYDYLVGFETLCCYKCGIPFGMTNDFIRRRREDGQSFYCPAGHSQCFCESEVKRLQRALDAKKRREEILEAEVANQRLSREATERSLSATKGVLTRTKNRVAKGICPCCNRSFQDLRRHMESQHPDFNQA